MKIKLPLLLLLHRIVVFQEIPFVSRPWEKPTISMAASFSPLKAASHLTISVRGKRAKFKGIITIKGVGGGGGGGASLRGKT